MKHKRRHDSAPLEPDMTPMIDMTFMLIAFFMVLINFSEADQNQAVTVPSSELAKPPEDPIESPLFLHVTNLEDDRYIFFGGQKLSPQELHDALYKEKLIIDDDPERSVGSTNIIIRGDRAAKTGRVQKVIAVCQMPDLGFERFMFRAKWEKEE